MGRRKREKIRKAKTFFRSFNIFDHVHFFSPFEPCQGRFSISAHFLRVLGGCALPSTQMGGGGKEGWLVGGT